MDRALLFQHHHAKIKQHNRKAGETSTLALNKFADWSDAEFGALLGLKRSKETRASLQSLATDEAAAASHRQLFRYARSCTRAAARRDVVLPCNVFPCHLTHKTSRVRASWHQTAGTRPSSSLCRRRSIGAALVLWGLSRTKAYAAPAGPSPPPKPCPRRFGCRQGSTCLSPSSK